MLPAETFKDKVQQCAVWENVREGNVHLISVDDVQELFYAFGVYGTLDTRELVKLCVLEARHQTGFICNNGRTWPDYAAMMLLLPRCHAAKRMMPMLVDGLGLTAQDVKEWIQDSDTEGIGEVTVEDVHRGLTRGNDHKSTECSLTELLDWLKFEYDKKSNLWSLPETLLLFFAFVLASAVHLGVFEAFRISQVYDLGLGFGDFLAYDMVDHETFWIWIERGFLRNIFRHDLFSFVRQYRIIGAVRARKWVTDPQECAIGEPWKAIYPSCHQQGSPRPEDWYIFYHQKREEQLRQFQEAGWMDANTLYLDLQIFTYNAHQVAFTMQNMRLEWSTAGYLIQRPGIRETFYAAPYYNLALVLPDLMLTSILHSELKEAIPAAMNGLDGIKDYLKFWNVVDWINVTVGIGCVSVWLVFVLKLTVELEEVLKGLPSEVLDLYVFTNRTYLTYEDSQGLLTICGRP
eukprot:s7652_g1.t1